MGRNRIVDKKYSLAAKFPHLLKEWHWEKNQELGISPYEILPGTTTKVYWICKKHEPYPASLGNRTHKTNPTGCPKCKSQTSRNELRIYFELRSIFGNVEHRVKDFGSEIDIYLPDHRLGIEYDGARFHKNKIVKDTKQIHDLELDNIKLIRVREKPLSKLGANDLSVSKNQLISHGDIAGLLRQIIKIRLKEISSQTAEDCQNYIKNGVFVADDEYLDTVINRFSVPFEQSLAAKFPEIAKDWDFERNYPYTPDIITPGVAGNASGELFYWLCSKDPMHPSYPAAVYSRTGKSKQGCPRCGGRYATHDNNLKSKHPVFAKMFDEAENYSDTGELLVASMITPSSGIKYDWLCPKGHLITSKSPDEILNNKEYLGCKTCRQLAIASGTHKFAHQKFDEQEIIKLFESGHTYEEIAKKEGCSIGNVGNIIIDYKKNNNMKIQSKVTDPIFCKELNRHFLSHAIAKEELIQLGYPIGNIPSVLRGDCKTTGGLSFSYSDLDKNQIENQDPSDFIEVPVQKLSNSKQEVYCVELEQKFPSKSAAIKALKKAGYPPFIQKTLNKAITTGGLAGGFHWVLVEE
ncbi:zinc-ribbon domain-containing protein [Paracoccaceae bacterium]|nr:zinc-ribbon domain-containing protein [Paracoccaceae bacterium]